MIGRRLTMGLSAVIALHGCSGEVVESRPQWEIVVATDAPIPQIGDRLLIEVLNDAGESACSGCRRQFGVASPDQWPVSFGVVPPESGQNVHVRARLYRSDDTGPDGLPGSTLILDSVGRLPSAAGITTVSLELRMDCFGVPADPKAKTTCHPDTGASDLEPVLPILSDSGAAPQPGSWPPAQATPCIGTLPDGMICVPGGILLLGNPHSLPLTTEQISLPEHLTRISAFALDTDEFTVGQMRDLVNNHGFAEPVKQGLDPNSLQGACTYINSQSGKNDTLPLNCVSFALASKICDFSKKRLPWEAEWEYAAGNTGKESRYPWGDDDAICDHTIVARGRDSFDLEEITQCRQNGTLPGLVAGGHPLDITTLGIKNLAGSVDEWIADVFSPYSGACWNPGPRLLQDPHCEVGENGAKSHAIRGGSWSFHAFRARAFERSSSLKDGPFPSTGLRCAMTM